MSIGRASGENRAQEAAQQAIQSSLLDISIEGAQGILFNVKGGDNLGLNEVSEAAELIRANAHPEANIIFGAVIDENMKDEIHMTVIATGFDKDRRPEQPSASTRQPTQSGTRPTGLTQPSQQPSQPPPKPKEPIDFPVRSFDREDLDIPAFLRRARNNNGQ